jgi:hypothetical protein
MADLIESKDVAANCFHVRDCYVWAEIYYLDSPTDYREYLPQNKTSAPAAGRGNLVMLDEVRPSGSQAKIYPLFLKFLIPLLLVIAGYVLYLIVDSF